MPKVQKRPTVGTLGLEPRPNHAQNVGCLPLHYMPVVPLGFEPRTREPKSRMFPLHYGTICNNIRISI